MPKNNFCKKNLISVPRSGQHITERALRFYSEKMNLPFEYCEFYTCCQSRPCKKKKDPYHKNHDFFLRNNGTGIEFNKKEEKYVFLYRNNPLQVMEAHFRLLFNKTIGKKFSDKLDYNNPYMKQSFKKFIDDWIKYYKKVYCKYLHDKGPNILHVEFYDYLKNFRTVFKKILLFFDLPVDEKIILQTKQFIKPICKLKIVPSDPYYKELKAYLKSKSTKKEMFCIPF